MPGLRATRPAARRAAEPAKALHKGRETRAAILDAALALAAAKGLEGLSIGVLADAIGMSKSGVFAHFGSREELQISVVREYHDRFEAEVFRPALREARGLPRLIALFNRWFKRVSAELDSGCIYISGAVEFDDRPGPVRDALVAMVRTWQQALARAVLAAIHEGHLRAECDPQQLLFELHGLVLALHHDARFLQSPHAGPRAQHAMDHLLMRDATTAGKAAVRRSSMAAVRPGRAAPSAVAAIVPAAARRRAARSRLEPSRARRSSPL